MKSTKSFSDNGPSVALEVESNLFNQLFKQHASGIYRLAHARLHSRAEAQDIVQECFLKLWEKRKKVSADPLAIKGYLYTSAYHAVLNQVRRQHTWIYQDYPENLPAASAPQPAELEYQELSFYYAQALQQLPTKRQQIFAMSRQQRLSNATIAQELNISVKTVEAQITQAIRFLRAYFQAYGVTLTLVMLLQA